MNKSLLSISNTTDFYEFLIRYRGLLTFNNLHKIIQLINDIIWPALDDNNVFLKKTGKTNIHF
jgi:hypothetical protein